MADLLITILLVYHRTFLQTPMLAILKCFAQNFELNVPETGIEPVQPFSGYWILSPARLPVPPPGYKSCQHSGCQHSVSDITENLLKM